MSIESQTNEATNATAAVATAPSTSTLITDKKTIESIKSLLNGSRKVFPDFEKAMESVQTISAKVAEMTQQEIAVVAANVGDLSTVESMEDERIAWATSGEYQIAVGFLGVKRPASEGGMAIRALVVFPMPSVAQYLDSDDGNDWLSKIVMKETAHVAFRNLRNVDASAGLEALYQTAARIPTTVAEFAAEQRESGLDASAFNAVWSHLRKEVVKSFPSLKEALPTKPEVINSIRSASYAEAEYPDLESAGIFAFLGNAAYQLADALTGADAVDADEIASWVESRDTYKIAPKERKTLDTKLDLSSFNIAG